MLTSEGVGLQPAVEPVLRLQGILVRWSCLPKLSSKYFLNVDLKFFILLKTSIEHQCVIVIKFGSLLRTFYSQNVYIMCVCSIWLLRFSVEEQMHSSKLSFSISAAISCFKPNNSVIPALNFVSDIIDLYFVVQKYIHRYKGEKVRHIE